MKINQKIIVYSLSVFLVATAIVYIMVANTEYQSYIEAVDFGIMSEASETQLETAFFIGAAIVYFGLCAWVLTKGNRKILPYIVSIIISIALIIVYIASRTVGVPVVGVELYVGQLDVIAKILQVIVIGLSGFATYNMKG